MNKHFKALCSVLVALNMGLSPLLHASMISMSDGHNASIVTVELKANIETTEITKVARCHQHQSNIEAIQSETHVAASTHFDDTSATDTCKVYCASSSSALPFNSILIAGHMRHLVLPSLTVISNTLIDPVPLLRPPIS